MKIPEEKIQEIRETIDIVDLISQYVTLKKRGNSFFGLCPFHTEKTPSFSVDPVRGFYYCFGCGAGGNVFSFVMQMEKVSFPEAIKSLAEKTGITLPRYQEDDRLIKEIEALYHANKFALEFFQKCLNETEEGKNAKIYISERGFNFENIEKFQIGYALDNWDSLLREAEKISIKQEILHQAGLVIHKKEEDGYYDRFRGRIMFPIINPSGRVVGFGGRTMKESEGVPKYINSPETQVYHKSHILYGLFQSKTGIRRENRALLVEGYTDIMRLHQSGFDYGVATSGTALTEEQARILSRYTKNVTLVFDGDSAGFSAALRGVDILVGTGLQVDVAPLPKGSDPDSFLRDRDKRAMEELLNTSKNFIDFSLDQMQEIGKLKSPGDRAEATRTILNTVSRIRDPLERSLMVKDLAEKLGLEEALLIRQLRKSKSGGADINSGLRQKQNSIKQIAEEGLIALIIENVEKWGKKIFHHLEPNHFQVSEARIIMKEFYSSYLKGKLVDIKILLDKYSEDPKVSQFITKLLSDGIGEEVDRSQFGLDCLLSLKQYEFQEQISQVREKLRTAQDKGEDVSDYSNEWIRLKQELGELKLKIEKVWKKDVEI